LFNLATGSGIQDDKMPPRMLELEREVGGRMSVPPFESMIGQYYELRGWNPESGHPRQEVLNRLGLEPIEV
jgi:aldehyde:ferredoxin oxidoreductase